MATSEWITLKEAAELLGISRQAVHRRILNGSLLAKEVRQEDGRSWIWHVRRADIDDLIATESVGPKYAARRRHSIAARKRQERRCKVDRLRRKGLTVKTIAVELAAAEPTISADLLALGYPKGERAGVFGAPRGRCRCESEHRQGC